MKRSEAPDIERLLKSVKLKPARLGLREKVLKRAGQYREEAAWTTPLLRWCLGGCAAVLLIVFVADGRISGAQRDRLTALAGRG